MNILVLHRVRYLDILYHKAIDHQANDVYYIGIEEKIAELPEDLRCTKIVRPGIEAPYKEVIAAVEPLGVKFDHVISVNEFELIDAAYIRQHFDIAGPRPEQVEKVRNKVVMKSCVERHNIKVPQYMSLSQFVEGQSLAVDAEQSIILKPLDGASSVDVVHFSSQQALRDALQSKTTGVESLDKAEQIDPSGFQVETYIEGPILHIDGMVRDGVIEMLVPSEYINTPLDFANGIPLGSIQFESTAELTAWVGIILKAVEISLGAFHLEAIRSSQGLVFLEIAHRVGGGGITECLARRTGMHPATAELGLLTDANFSLDSQWDKQHLYGFVIVPGHQLAGDYCQVSGHEFLHDSGNLISMHQLVTDSKVSRVVTYKENELPLACLLKAKDTQRLRDVVGRLFEQLEIRTSKTPF
ncbi:ATP-grasp domain-containing protein [Rheinheimera sp. WS51]|uniref:ATP-grasp domain-containing protein n=1 Tax=Rheinheimera sp. WS51 TaxID=3425886 RepID=UPI003D89CB0C